MRSTFSEQDVVLLLKDITGMVEPKPAEERERLIQQGMHYSEMLPIEYVPTEQYMNIYEKVLHYYAKPTSLAVGKLADKIIAAKSKNVVLVSLARAGTPIGVLLKRYIRLKYQIDVPHYSISIIRDRGIDDNAMKYLLHLYQPGQLLFVDGWIGKGAIWSQLKKDIAASYGGVSSEIAVVADPAKITKLFGTQEDILIPSSCLNSTVTGLISRTFLRSDVIGKNDFHGAVYYGELLKNDLTYQFIKEIEDNFELTDSEIILDKRDKDIFDERESGKIEHNLTGITETENIAAAFGVSNINFIKPGIGETTRVLLRRIPWKILIGEQYKNDSSLSHILQLAEEKNVPVVSYPLYNYKACGIIRQLEDT